MHAIPHAIDLSGASMTLAGLLPPLCDNGSMLVDGGYRTCFSVPLGTALTRLLVPVDNLPVSNRGSLSQVTDLTRFL